MRVAEAMVIRRPFASIDDATSAARDVAASLREVEWNEVFASVAAGDGQRDCHRPHDPTGESAREEMLERCVEVLRLVDGVVDSSMDNHHIDLSWDPTPAKKVLFGGVDYHQNLTAKVTVTESAVKDLTASQMLNAPSKAEVAAIEQKSLPRFFGGSWR